MQKLPSMSEYWQRLDARIGRAVRRELNPRDAQILRSALVLLCLTGMILALVHPTSAAVWLLFPLLVVSLLEGLQVGFLVCPLLLSVFWLGPVSLWDLFLLTGLSFFAVCMAGVTASKYRHLYQHRRRLLRRLEVAREVQRTMEPPPSLLVGPIQMLTSMEVCHELGGDFVGARPLEDGGALVVVGDVQGKGPQSALTAAYLEGVFHHCCLEGVARPEEVLWRMHQLLESKDAGRFVTVMCLRIDKTGRFWRVANAGHPLPIVFGGPAQRVGTTGIVLGLAGIFEVGICDFELTSGQRMLLLSDGCYEEETVSESLHRLLGCKDLCFQDILDWVGQSCLEHSDDRTVVLLSTLATRASDGKD